MNIGDISISQTGCVLFNSEFVGTVARFDFHCTVNSQRGHLSLIPCESSVDAQAMAISLAANGVSLSLDYYDKFWPNSYIRDGMWYMEVAPEDIVCLNIQASLPEQIEDPADDSASGAY